MKFIKNYTLKELLYAVNYTENIIGDINSVVAGFSDDYFAGENDITWTADKHILNKLLKLKHNLTIITDIREVGQFNGKNVILSSNPLRLFEAIVNKFFSYSCEITRIGNNTNIHKTAIIGTNVIIGDNCIIEPYVVIRDNTIIGNNVYIGSFSTIGNNPYYTLWDKNKRLRTRKIFGNVLIGDGVKIGSYCSIDNGITSSTEIAKECKLGNYVEIGHDVKILNNCCICAQCAIGGFVTIGTGCILWGRVGIANRIEIASDTTLLAASVVTKSILTPGKSYCGYPAMERLKYWKRIINR